MKFCGREKSNSGPYNLRPSKIPFTETWYNSFLKERYSSIEQLKNLNIPNI